MTKLLEQVFSAASRLKADEQDALARRLLAEMEDDAEWDSAFSDSQDLLDDMAREVREQLKDPKNFVETDEL